MIVFIQVFGAPMTSRVLDQTADRVLIQLSLLVLPMHSETRRQERWSGLIADKVWAPWLSSWGARTSDLVAEPVLLSESELDPESLLLLVFAAPALCVDPDIFAAAHGFADTDLISLRPCA